MFAAMAAVPANATPAIAATVISEVLPASDFFGDFGSDVDAIAETVEIGARVDGQLKANVW